MPAKESRYPEDWFKKAKRDLERVNRRMQEKDIEDAAIHLQQALEKYLKGYLLSKGWKLKPTHDLKELLDEAVKFNSDLEQFYDLCLEVTPYYIEERYPFFIEEPSLEDVEHYFKSAQEFIKRMV
ncbi:MAG: HEPN domain-containing protein [bacterium]|nr:HEPN domain-containing protein [bacterium]